MKRRIRHRVLGWLALGVTACNGAGPVSNTGDESPTAPVVAGGLACVLSAPTTVRLAEPVVPVGFTLRNDDGAAITVLKRQTPLEGFLGDLFEVTLEGRRVEYRGRMVKRGPPTAVEFVTVGTGSHVHATVDLVEGYDLSQPGRYRVRFPRHDEFACNELTIERT